MGELPLGTIRMLSSDVEGSTALLSRLGDRYGEAMPAQHAILRGLFCACGHAGNGERPGGWPFPPPYSSVARPRRAEPGQGARIGRLAGEAS